MRTLLVVAILATSILAGCSDKGGHDDTFTCPDGKEIDLSIYPDHDNATFNASSKCPKTSGTGTNSTSNTTSRAPNVLPSLLFNTKDDAGAVTNITVLNGNLTFDATGSADSDGTITGLAATVTDSNQTRTVTLFDAVTKTFTPKTLSFDRAGKVNVSVAVVDDRGGFTTLNTQVFVDEPQTVTNTFQSPFTYNSNVGDGCNTELGQPAIDSFYFANKSFTVADDASWIEAAVIDGAASISICSPNAEVLSGAPAATAVTNEGVPLPAARGVASYFIGIYGGPAPQNTVLVNIVVHYGPKPAA